jgi:hypothetical protein
MKTLYGLKIYAHTPERKYDYTHHTVFSSEKRAYNVRHTILEFYNKDNLITHIDVIKLNYDKRRK